MPQIEDRGVLRLEHLAGGGIELETAELIRGTDPAIIQKGQRHEGAAPQPAPHANEWQNPRDLPVGTGPEVEGLVPITALDHPSPATQMTMAGFGTLRDIGIPGGVVGGLDGVHGTGPRLVWRRALPAHGNPPELSLGSVRNKPRWGLETRAPCLGGHF